MTNDLWSSATFAMSFDLLAGQKASSPGCSTDNFTNSCYFFAAGLASGIFGRSSKRVYWFSSRQRSSFDYCFDHSAYLISLCLQKMVI